MKKKGIIIFIALSSIAAILVYNYMYQDHRNIETETSSFKLTASDIANEFAINPIESENKYLNKTIEVNGIITDKNANDLTINDKVFCVFSSPVDNSLVNNSPVKVKGRFIGYDDLLEQVKLDQSTIIKQ